MDENKCVACAGDGLIRQGESIKFTCAACSGTGKAVDAVMGEEEVVTPEEVPAVEESFSPESEEVGATSEGSDEEVPA